MRAMFYRIHACTPGDLYVYVCDQDCRVRLSLSRARSLVSLSLSLSASVACVLCSTQFTLAPLAISFCVCAHARSFGCLACLGKTTDEGAVNDTSEGEAVRSRARGRS